MQIIHVSDLHLGSRLTSLPIGNIRENRKNEILKSFNRLIDYAKEHNIKIIMLAGDVFDSDRPYKKDKSFFYDSVKANKEITFLYLRGNHDIEESLVENLDNLKTFNNEWITYSFEGVSISGIELSSNNKTSLYSSLSLNENCLNIVMMHGDVNTKGKEFIDLKKLSNKNIDYLALGHIHAYKEFIIDKRGIAIYPGCLDGRGFDELDEKGFVVLDIDNNTIKHKFIPFSSRVIVEKRIDISNALNLYEAKNLIQNELSSIDSSSLVKIILTGKVDFEIGNIEDTIHSFFADNFFYLKVYNELKKTINIDDYKNDFSLKGEFVRNISSNSNLTAEEKEELLNIGMKLLNGEDIE